MVAALPIFRGALKPFMVSWLAKVIWIWDLLSGSLLDRFHVSV